MSATDRFGDGKVTANVEHIGGVENTSRMSQLGGNASDTSTRQLGSTRGVADINPVSLTHGGTHAEATTYFQYPAGNVIVTNDSIPGTLLFQKQLDWTLDNNLNNTTPRWMQYKLENVRVTFTSLAPLGTTSGGITIGSNPDPSNPIGTDASKSLEMLNALTGSSILNAKTDSHVDYKGTDDWKWCKKAGVPRLESFGEIVSIVRMPSAVQTVAQWAVNVSGTIRYRGKTVDTSAFPAVSYQDHTFLDLDNAVLIPSSGNYYICFPVPEDAPDGAMVTTINTLLYHASFTADGGLRKISTGMVTNLIIRTVTSRAVQKYATISAELPDGADWTAEDINIVGDRAKSVWLVSATVSSGYNCVPLYALQASSVPGLDDLAVAFRNPAH
jgi:hypothetical protein